MSAGIALPCITGLGAPPQVGCIETALQSFASSANSLLAEWIDQITGLEPGYTGFATSGFFSDVSTLISSCNDCFANQNGVTIFFGIAVEGTFLPFGPAKSAGFLISSTGQIRFFLSDCAGLSTGASTGVGGLLGVMLDAQLSSFISLGGGLTIAGSGDIGSGLTLARSLNYPPIYTVALTVGADVGLTVGRFVCGSIEVLIATTATLP